MWDIVPVERIGAWKKSYEIILNSAQGRTKSEHICTTVIDSESGAFFLTTLQDSR